MNLPTLVQFLQNLVLPERVEPEKKLRTKPTTVWEFWVFPKHKSALALLHFRNNWDSRAIMLLNIPAGTVCSSKPSGKAEGWIHHRDKLALLSPALLCSHKRFSFWSGNIHKWQIQNQGLSKNKDTRRTVASLWLYCSCCPRFVLSVKWSTASTFTGFTKAAVLLCDWNTYSLFSVDFSGCSTALWFTRPPECPESG